MRLPLGIWTDRFGGRIVMTLLLVICAIPVYIVSYATALWQFLLIGLFLGCVGASFAVGTPYVARFFPSARHGFAMGFFGAGTVGAGVNLFITPSLQAAYGWRFVPRAYAIALVVTAAIFWFASARDPGAGKTQGSLLDSFKVLRDPRVWRLCQYYSITFGGFTALSLWMPQYLQGQYGITLVAASAFAAGFSLPGSILRAVGGGLAGGLGGFLLPILFGAIQDLVRIRSTCFMLLYGIVWVSLILLYLSEVRRTPITGQRAEEQPGS